MDTTRVIIVGDFECPVHTTLICDNRINCGGEEEKLIRQTAEPKSLLNIPERVLAQETTEEENKETELAMGWRKEERAKTGEDEDRRLEPEEKAGEESKKPDVAEARIRYAKQHALWGDRVEYEKDDIDAFSMTQIKNATSVVANEKMEDTVEEAVAAAEITGELLLEEGCNLEEVEKGRQHAEGNPEEENKKNPQESDVVMGQEEQPSLGGDTVEYDEEAVVTSQELNEEEYGWTIYTSRKAKQKNKKGNVGTRQEEGAATKIIEERARAMEAKEKKNKRNAKGKVDLITTSTLDEMREKKPVRKRKQKEKTEEERDLERREQEAAAVKLIEQCVSEEQEKAEKREIRNAKKAQRRAEKAQQEEKERAARERNKARKAKTKNETKGVSHEESSVYETEEIPIKMEPIALNSQSDLTMQAKRKKTMMQPYIWVLLTALAVFPASVFILLG